MELSAGLSPSMRGMSGIAHSTEDSTMMQHRSDKGFVEQSTSVPRLPRRRRPEWGLLAVLVAIVAGCQNPFVELCRTPPIVSTESKPAEIQPPVVEPAPESKPVEPYVPPKPVENRPVEIVRQTDSPPVIQTPPRVVAMQTPAEPKVLHLDPDLVTVTPGWVKSKKEPTLQRVEAAEVKSPKIIAERIELHPLPAKSSQDRKVVAIARLVGIDGQPLLDAEVEWSIDRAGVGIIVGAGGQNGPDARSFRRSSLLAVCRTSSAPYPLAPHVATDDPITIHPGEAWCVLESHAPGDMIVSARSADIESTEKCQVNHRMHWYEAKLEAGEYVEVQDAQEAAVTAKVVNFAGEPLIGYSVRFEVVDTGMASFPREKLVRSPDDEQVSDAAGHVLSSLRLNDEAAEKTRVRLQLFGRPVLPGPPTLLDDRMVTVRWKHSGPVDLDVHGPPLAAVGSTVTLSAVLGETLTRKELTGQVVAIVGDGVDVVSSVPASRNETGVRFALANIGAETNGKATELAITSKQTGIRRVRFEVREADKIHASREALVRFVEPQLTVKKTLPKEWLVGQQAHYLVSVENTGEIPAGEVVVEDEIPGGLRVDQTDGTRFIDRIRWKIPTLAIGEKMEFRVTATPEQPFERLAVRAWAKDSLSPSVEAFDILTIVGIETVEVSIDDELDPAPIDGRAEYTIHLMNRGTAPAKGISLDVQLSSQLKVMNTEGTLRGSILNGGLRLPSTVNLAPGEHLYCRVQAQPVKEGDARLQVAVRHPSVGPTGLVEQESTHVYKP
ncbi:DUF11 domain-containing protein [bacterium]|nr:DUF11 domain-containing protein [bacterium]